MKCMDVLREDMKVVGVRDEDVMDRVKGRCLTVVTPERESLYVFGNMQLLKKLFV